jgi:hypothetical protein
MMMRKQPILAVIIAVMVFLAYTSFPALAARKGGPGPKGTAWAENSFSAFGQVTAVTAPTETLPGTISVKVDKGGRLLKDHFGADAEPVTFQLSDNVKIMGFGKGHGMGGHGGRRGGGKGYGGKMMTLAEVLEGDFVLIAGTHENATETTPETFTATMIKVWVY